MLWMSTRLSGRGIDEGEFICFDTAFYRYQEHGVLVAFEGQNGEDSTIRSAGFALVRQHEEAKYIRVGHAIVYIEFTNILSLVMNKRFKAAHRVSLQN